ncbi:hypothetical protein JAAARDRAFT_35992 [Jaapia argillacea MUCL 33604]|uniref:THUMP domain-containing protein n=1 Tax=Jaapia argillacea MUCL 33604 TaxID=933084 RepID=A0A067Q451_9AGAM|nr:hypothetical protein JAAARDRAFT_35992 [Jaapia argillacea MUCL 33604]
MSEGNKRKSGSKGGGDRDKRKRYRHDGTPIWGKRTVDGPGVWVTCVRGKEKQVVGELYDVFESLADEMWPSSEELGDVGEDEDDDEGDEELSLEEQVRREVEKMKKPRKAKGSRFANCQTNTSCVVFIGCKSPVDPVALVRKHVENVLRTGITHTRFTQRLTPVSSACVANIPEIKGLCRRVILPFFENRSDKIYTYKIEIRSRHHNTISRDSIIQEVVACIPSQHKVDLSDPDVFVLVELFRSVCGMSVVEDYYQLQKFNVMEIANTKNEEVKFREGDGRVGDIREREKEGEMLVEDSP